MKKIKNGVRLTGGEQIILLVKSTLKSWKRYFEWFEKLSKRFGEDYRRSWIDGGKRLHEFEKQHKIRFVAVGNEIFYKQRGGVR